MAEKCIELDSVEIAAAVFGNCDRNIRLLEKEFSVTAVCRGTQLRISGEPAMWRQRTAPWRECFF